MFIVLAIFYCNVPFSPHKIWFAETMMFKKNNILLKRDLFILTIESILYMKKIIVFLHESPDYKDSKRFFLGMTHITGAKQSIGHLINVIG